MVRTRITLLSLLALVLVITASVSAGVPQLINYQGRLTDTNEEIVPDGNYSVTFKIYDDPVSTSHLWAEGQLVTVQDGLFAVILGSVTSYTVDLFDGPDRWLGIQVGLDPEIAPRSKLTSVPFAVHAGSAISADMATESLDKTIDAGDLIQGTLDAERFSAYDDLVAEGAVGAGSGHVASGDHVHQLTEVIWFEESSYVSRSISSTDGTVVLKLLTLPAYSVNGHMRIFWDISVPSSSGCQSGDQIQVKLMVNNSTVFTSPYSNAYTRGGLSLLRHNGDSFYQIVLAGHPDASYAGATIDATQPIEVSITARAESPCTYTVVVGALVVEVVGQ